VLVLETVGGVDEFVRAVRKTPEMEWLGEWEQEDIESNDDFYQISEPEKSLSGRSYLLMFKSHIWSGLPPLTPLYATKHTLVSFVLNSLQTLFCKTGGWGLKRWDRRPKAFPRMGNSENRASSLRNQKLRAGEVIRRISNVELPALRPFAGRLRLLAWSRLCRPTPRCSAPRSSARHPGRPRPLGRAAGGRCRAAESLLSRYPPPGRNIVSGFRTH
jgi:hypothetical protein